jgi:tetratricopeptide (TPR) repeat protein
VALALVLIGGAGYWWYRAHLPSPPAVDTSACEPEVIAAIEAARTRVAEQPRSGAVWGHLGMVLLAHNFEAEAATCFERAQQLDPSEARWPYLHGRVVAQRDPEAALPLLRRAGALARDTNVPRLHLADVLFNQGHLDEAAEEYRRVLREEPNNARANLGLGGLLLRRGDLDGSTRYLQRAVQAMPKLRAAHAQLAEIYKRRGESQAEGSELALLATCQDVDSWPDRYLDEMNALQVGAEGRLERADRLGNAGRWDEALRVLRETVQAAPQSFKARLALGRRLAMVGETLEAEAELKAALQLRSDSIDALAELAMLLQKKGAYRDAAGCYEKILKRQPGHALAHFHLANCREQLGDRAGAIESLRASQRCKPDFAWAHKVLGRLLAEKNDNAEAAEQLQDALRLNPDDNETRELLKRVTARISAQKQ